MLLTRTGKRHANAIRLLVVAVLLSPALAAWFPDHRQADAFTAVVISKNDPLLAPARGNPEQVIAFAQAQGASPMSEVRNYVYEVYRLAPLVGLDPAVVVTQSAHETGNWTSYYWRNFYNAAGIGIYADGVNSYRWASGTASARYHLVHLYVYAVGPPQTGNPLFPYVKDGPGFGAAVLLGYAGRCHIIDDLTGRWAVDPIYGDKLAARGSYMFRGTTPAPPTEPGLTLVGSSGDGGDPALAQDGNLETAWQVSGVTPPPSASLTFDMGGRRFLSNIQWVFKTSGYADRYSVQVSTDNRAWTTIGNFRNAPAKVWQSLASTRNTRYVRFLFRNLNGDRTLGSLAEVRIYGSTSLAPTPFPTPSTTPERELGIGDPIMVATDALNLRPVPTTQGNTPIATLLTGTKGTITDGPATGDGMQWWKIATSGKTGWVAAQYVALDPSRPRPTPEATASATPLVTPRALTTVRIASSSDTTDPALARDGNVASDWHTTSATTPVSARIIFDLGEVVDLQRVEWQFNLDGGAEFYRLGYSVDYTTWGSLGAFSGSKAGATIGRNVAVQARYVRFVFTNPTGAPVLGYLAEVRFTGTAKAEPTATPAATDTPAATATPVATETGTATAVPTGTATPGAAEAAVTGTLLPVVAVSSDPSSAPNLAVDGDVTSSWVTTDGALAEASLTLDTGATGSISAIRWQIGLGGEAQRYSIALSDDQLTWTAIETGDAAATGVWRTTVVDGPARYVRFSVERANGATTLGDVAEIEVYGSPRVEATATPTPTTTAEPSATATPTEIVVATATATPIATAEPSPAETPAPLPTATTPPPPEPTAPEASPEP